jgi:hypothetical protein
MAGGRFPSLEWVIQTLFFFCVLSSEKKYKGTAMVTAEV